ncbi:MULTISPECIES: ATP-binding protein [unclassified Microcoleus]|uniref:ATP-binding protein n=1 Tax=unclassified Microcoleus TaxID=2642155 RepID=UPI001E1901E7|nr:MULTISPECIES: ATP-binding protein [unclassified Microcoleus]MCC3442328.1 DNA gyrase subunit B [Microcoleus sp. PH2017_03_ELD_O_A]MCC3502880.1 DNA gyrase subunit B [Microcoleus sp. PH2017_19_SFW_U_A]TAE14784.1 MAG: DNA gyrase subunit B [Oscillatoriales cyanobacterium]MCC3410875.1 DNA gyrase subunit B [Microcoleus sp. PH2017_02_FOX_O_A]MCC3435297.1 DNA gyrase subunit B [Microcoleus sp. PH2017_05_CCC_O_A]
MTNTYSADQIQVLQGLEAVRKRPRMYIGSTSPRGLHHLVYEIVDNAIDEALAGYCTRIEVDLNADGSVTVTDNGRGIPTKIHPKTGTSFLEAVLTVLCFVGRSSDGYKVSGGIHGVGLAVVNALSEWLQVTVRRQEQIYSQRFEKGIAVTSLTAKPSPENPTGTSICFKPDAEIFKNGIQFDRDTFALHLRQLAYLNPGLKIILTDNRLQILGSSSPCIETYCFPGGIREYVAYLNSNVEPLHEDIIYIQGDRDGVQVEIACQWHFLNQDNSYSRLLGFANCVRNIDGGTYLNAFQLAVRRVVSAIGRQQGKLKNTDPVLMGNEVLECGFTAVIAVKLPNPEFEGPTKTRLVNPEVQEIVKSLVEKELMEYLTARREVAGAIAQQAIEARDAEAETLKARALRRKQELQKY